MADVTKLVKALRQKTKYELAHETAQKNAVDMLGLPPDNTAMDRAKALGFDQEAYTGVNTTGEIDEMLPKSWFSEQPKYASDYSNVIPSSGIKGEPRVYPVLLKTGNVKSTQYTGLYDDMENALSKKRTNTFKVENVGGGDNNFYVTKDPNQIRSKFAAFDPARINEADLLGYATPAMMGTLATATGAGVIGANKAKNKQLAEAIKKGNTLKAPERNKVLGMLADALKPVRDYASTVNVPILNESLADLTGLNGTQSLADDMSYGKPLFSGGSVQTSQIDPRVLDVANFAPMALGTVKPLAKMLKVK